MAVDPEKMDEKAENNKLQGTRPEDDDTAASITTTDRDVEVESIDAVPDQLLTPNGILVDEEAAATVPMGRVRSQASSARSKPLSIVPRLKRRGFLAQLTLIPEVERPYDYPNKVKWTITVFIALAACAAPMGSAIFYRKRIYTFHYSVAQTPFSQGVLEDSPDHISCPSGHVKGPRCLTNSCKFDGSIIHVSNVNLPALVEFFLRNSRTS